MSRRLARLAEPLRRAWALRRTIRVRLTLWYAALLAATLAAFGGFLYVNLARGLHAQLDRALAADAQQVNAMLDLDKERLKIKEDGRLIEPGILVVIYDRAGREFYSNDKGHALPAMDEALARAAQAGEAYQTVRLASGAAWRVLVTSAVAEERAVVGVLLVAHTLGDTEAALRWSVTLLVTAGPVLLALAVGVGVFLAGRALDPIDRIVRTSEQIGAEDLSRRLHLPPSPDEVGRLAATFDQMLDRLDRAFQRQRQFTADAAHELRTPLALLIAQADAALARPRRAEEYRAALASGREDAARLSQLLNELLTLARADAGELPLDLEPLELNALADDVLLTLAPLAAARGVRLGRPPRGPAVPVEADQTRLTQLLVNLIDNGLKYTPAGGAVTVSVGHTPAAAVLRVTDTGVGIAPEHLPHVFERFYRADKARSRGEGGAGLGLAICRWIAQAHGGDITVASEPDRGTTFTVRLPLARVQSPLPGPRRRPLAALPVR